MPSSPSGRRMAVTVSDAMRALGEDLETEIFRRRFGYVRRRSWWRSKTFSTPSSTIDCRPRSRANIAGLAWGEWRLSDLEEVLVLLHVEVVARGCASLVCLPCFLAEGDHGDAGRRATHDFWAAVARTSMPHASTAMGIPPADETASTRIRASDSSWTVLQISSRGLETPLEDSLWVRITAL